MVTNGYPSNTAVRPHPVARDVLVVDPFVLVCVVGARLFVFDSHDNLQVCIDPRAEPRWGMPVSLPQDKAIPNRISFFNYYFQALMLTQR